VKQRGYQAEQQLEPLFFRCSPRFNALSLKWTARAARDKLRGKISRKRAFALLQKKHQISLKSQTESCLSHQSGQFIIPDITMGVLGSQDNLV